MNDNGYDVANNWEYVAHFGKRYLYLFDVTQADLNWENPEVREELKNVLRFWKGKVVKVLKFLMNSRGRFISGADFLIDGGTTASYWFGNCRE